MHPMDVEAMPVASLRPYERNAGTHSEVDRQIANSIERFVAVRRGLCVSRPMISGPKGFAPGPFEGETR
jgi:hypothetical protein